MANKTPVTQLQEMCMKHKHGPPFYDLTHDGSSEASTGGNSLFIYEVSAFGQVASGQGKNKREAKHEAAINIINMLRKLPEFAAELQNVDVLQSNIPRSSLNEDGSDAVGTLLNICVQREWPLAEFTVQQAFGAAHAPEFRVECRLASIVRIGNYSTKKRAKQIAAQAVLDVIQALPVDEHQQQIATMQEQAPDQVVKTYRELRKSDIKYTGTKLCNRHRFFERISDVDKQKWHTIFYKIDETPCEKVGMICRAMGWKPQVTPITEIVGKRLKIFELNGCNFDVLIHGEEPLLYEKVLNFFQEMSCITLTSFQ